MSDEAAEHTRLYAEHLELVRAEEQRRTSIVIEMLGKCVPPPLSEEQRNAELRDYFAARAMQATLSSDTAVAEIMASDMGADRAGLAASVAEVAYMFADAMLRFRASAQHEGHGETGTI